MDKFRHYLVKGANHVEVVIAFLVTVGIVVGMFSVIQYIIKIPGLDMYDTYDYVKKFLGLTLSII